MKKKTMKKILYWSPRILAILFAAFLSIFAFDVFGGGESIFLQIVAFLIHMIPTFILVGIIFISWKWELAGGILFVLLGITFTIFFNTYREIISFMLISFPVFLTGALFLLCWRFGDNRK